MYFQAPDPLCPVAIFGEKHFSLVFVLYQKNATVGEIQTFDGTLPTLEQDIGNSNVESTYGTKDMLTFYPGISAIVKDYYYIHTTEHLYILYESNYNYYHFSGGAWNKQMANALPFADEYGSLAPVTVDAAEFDQTTWELYLIEANMVYHYYVSDVHPPGLRYILEGVFDFRVNSISNPFSAGTESALDSPPAWVHALYVSNVMVLAFAADHIYKYDRITRSWSKSYRIPCPVFIKFHNNV